MKQIKGKRIDAARATMSRMYEVILLGMLCLYFASAPVSANCADKDPYYWTDERKLAVYDVLMQFMQCKDYGNRTENALNDSSACNWFVARALQKVYGINDFTPEGGGWKSANEIAAEVEASDNWIKLGAASDQTVLGNAANGAASGVAVIAVSTSDQHGHVALVLKGPLVSSSTWGLDVPNSASFRLGDAENSYIGCKLSYAWGKPSNVLIYARK